MLRHLIIPLLLGTSASVLTAQGSASRSKYPSSAARPTIRVSPNVHVSAARSGLIYNEVLLSASASDPNLLVACSLSSPPDEIIGPTGPTSGGIYDIAYFSSDAGKNWRTALDTTRNRGDNHCSFGADNTLYLTGTRPTKKDDERYIVTRSRDSGRTWQESAVNPPQSYGVDREYLVIDDTHSKYRGRVYITAHTIVKNVDGKTTGKNPMALTLWRSLDSGRTFERPLKIQTGDSTTTTNPWQGVVMRDGTIVFPFNEWPTIKWPANEFSVNMRVIVSHDGGDTFETAHTVGTATFRRVPGHAFFWNQFMTGFAADRTDGPYADRLYIAWADQKNGGDTASTEIYTAYSTDTGKTWSPPIRVGEYPPDVRRAARIGNAMPVIAVNNKGVVGLQWYDRRRFPDVGGYDVRFAASTDGGETWTPSVLVSEKPLTFGGPERTTLQTQFGESANPAKGRVAVHAIIQDWPDAGHTAGLTPSADGRFHSLWVDNRTGINQIYTTVIDVDGNAARNGDASVASLDAISDSVELEVTRSSWDAKTTSMHLSLRLHNKSKTAIATPLLVRVVALNSDYGRPALLDADNAVDGTGALLDFSGLTAGGTLAPGAVTGVREVTVKLGEFKDFSGHIGWAHIKSVVDLEGRVYGKLSR